MRRQEPTPEEIPLTVAVDESAPPADEEGAMESLVRWAISVVRERRKKKRQAEAVGVMTPERPVF